MCYCYQHQHQIDDSFFCYSFLLWYFVFFFHFFVVFVVVIKKKSFAYRPFLSLTPTGSRRCPSSLFTLQIFKKNRLCVYAWLGSICYSIFFCFWEKKSSTKGNVQKKEKIMYNWSPFRRQNYRQIWLKCTKLYSGVSENYPGELRYDFVEKLCCFADWGFCLIFTSFYPWDWPSSYHSIPYK